MALQDYASMLNQFDLVEADKRIAQNRGLQNANLAFQRESADADRRLARESLLQKAARDALDPTTGTLDPAKYRRSLGELGDYSGLHAFDKDEAAKVKAGHESAKAQREAEKEQLLSAKAKLELIGQVAGAARDDQSYARGLEALKSAGIDTSQIPAQYDPDYVVQAAKQALSGAQQIEQVWKQKNFDLDVDKFGEAKRHSKAMESNAAGQLAVSQGNLGVARSNVGLRAKELDQGGGQSKPPAGYRWGPNGDLVAIPGGPAGKSAAASEGERKAATLLQRLEGSQAQLSAALTENPGAAKPGLIAQGMRNIGAETLANTVATSPERQRVEAAQLDMLDAALTLGTGAAYTREQLEGYRRSYFPQIGDDKGTIKDKQERLANVIDAAYTQAGRAAPKKQGLGGSKPAAPAAKPSLDDIFK